MAKRWVESNRDSPNAYAGWNDVYADNVGWIYRLLYAKVGNRADAEDLTTEVFLAALRPLDVAASRPEVRAYLKLTVRSVLARHWRRHYGMEITRLPGDVADTDDEYPTDNAPTRERAHAVIATLSDRYRRVLELRFLEGMPIKDVAREMGVSVGNAKVLQHRALAAAARSSDHP